MHDYLAHAPQVVFILASLAVLGLAADARARRHSPVPLATLGVGAFVAQEHLERLIHTGHVPFLFASPVHVGRHRAAAAACGRRSGSSPVAWRRTSRLLCTRAARRVAAALAGDCSRTRLRPVGSAPSAACPARGPPDPLLTVVLCRARPGAAHHSRLRRPSCVVALITAIALVGDRNPRCRKPASAAVQARHDHDHRRQRPARRRHPAPDR